MTPPPLLDEVRAIALLHAPSKVRSALAALWALDEALGRIVRTTTEPMLGQMRLTWWHEQLRELDRSQVAAEPVILALSDIVATGRLHGSDLAGLVDGWEALLEPLPLSQAVLDDYATDRGGRLFEMSARLLSREMPVTLGEGWALVDFAGRCSDNTTANRAWAMARARLQGQPIKGPKPLRILARIAAAKAKRPASLRGDPPSRWELLGAVLR